MRVTGELKPIQIGLGAPSAAVSANEAASLLRLTPGRSGLTVPAAMLTVTAPSAVGVRSNIQPRLGGSADQVLVRRFDRVALVALNEERVGAVIWMPNRTRTVTGPLIVASLGSERGETSIGSLTPRVSTATRLISTEMSLVCAAIRPPDHPASSATAATARASMALPAASSGEPGHVYPPTPHERFVNAA